MLENIWGLGKQGCSQLVAHFTTPIDSHGLHQASQFIGFVLFQPGSLPC